jgi:hypothetical protein
MTPFRHTFRSLGLTLEATVAHWYPGAPARLSGPPEDCYPEDPPECEIGYLMAEHEGGWMDATFLLESDCVEEIVEDCTQSLLAARDEE